MDNEYIVEKFEYKNNNVNENRVIRKLRQIGNDSLFYFALFLTAFLLLDLFPYFAGIVNSFNVGINEVIVSLLGFVNVFFYKVFFKMLKTAKLD